MARETHTFGSPEDLATYLAAATRKTPERIAEIVASVIDDGVILLDNGKIFGFRAWEITYEDETFAVVHEFGYLTADGEVV
jgi:hypothetical protein